MSKCTGTLYTCPNYFRSYRIEIAAQYGGYQLTKVLMQPDGTCASADFQAVSPTGAVPAFKSCEGVALFDASAIAAFVGGAALSGGDCPVARAQVSQWCSYADQVVLPAALTWVLPCLGVSAYNKTTTDKAREEIRAALAALNKHLDSRTFVVGERVTQADITLACNLLLLFTHVLEPSVRTEFQNVTRWFMTVVNQPQAARVIGAVTLADKMATFDSKKYAELHPKAGGAAAAAPKKAAKKAAEEKKPAAPKKVAEEPAAAPVDKAVDPFAKIPTGKLNLDEFKREFSNKSPAEARDYFWKNFDPEHYSIWYSEYLFPEELRMLFMSANLVSGMFQRLDRLRKHAFGLVGIFGENNKSTISGMWIWRGHDLAFELHEDLQIDYESYKWTKLDCCCPETKKRVDSYFFFDDSANNMIEGKKFSEVKVYK